MCRRHPHALLGAGGTEGKATADRGFGLRAVANVDQAAVSVEETARPRRPEDELAPTAHQARGILPAQLRQSSLVLLLDGRERVHVVTAERAPGACEACTRPNEQLGGARAEG